MMASWGLVVGGGGIRCKKKTFVDMKSAFNFGLHNELHFVSEDISSDRPWVIAKTPAFNRQRLAGDPRPRGPSCSEWRGGHTEFATGDAL